MRVMTGRVVDGKIEVAGELEDGTAVAVLAADGAEFSLTEEEEEELSIALGEIRSGDYVDGHQLLRDLKGAARR